MNKKIVIPYTQIENLDALLATMAIAGDEETDITIVRVLSDTPENSEKLFSELKGLSAQTQHHLNWHIKVAQPPLTV